MSLLCYRFVVCDLVSQVGKDCVYCKGIIGDNDILIGLCKTPCTSRVPSAPGSSSSTRSGKSRMNAMRSSWHRLGWNWRRAPASAWLCRWVSPVRTRNRYSYFLSLFSCLSWSSGRAPYTVDLYLGRAWGLSLKVFAGVLLHHAPACIIFTYCQQTFVVRGLARLPAGAFSSSVGGGLFNFVPVRFPSLKKSVGCCIPFMKLVASRVPRSD